MHESFREYMNSPSVATGKSPHLPLSIIDTEKINHVIGKMPTNQPKKFETLRNPKSYIIALRCVHLCRLSASTIYIPYNSTLMCAY